MNLEIFSSIWFFLLINIIAFSFTPVFQKKIAVDSRVHPVMGAGFFRLIVSALILLMYLVFSRESDPIKFDFFSINFFLMPVLYGTAAVLSMYALRKITSSEYALIYSSNIIWTVIGAVVFLGEKLAFFSGVGVVLILLAVVLISIPKKESKNSNKFKIEPGHLLTVVAAVCFGLAFVNDAVLVKDSNEILYGAIAFFTPTILSFVLFPKALSTGKYLLNKKSLLTNIPLAFLYALSYIAILSAYKNGGQVSIIIPLAQAATLLSVIWGYIFWKERSNLLLKLAAFILLLSGAIFLSV